MSPKGILLRWERVIWLCVWVIGLGLHSWDTTNTIRTHEQATQQQLRAYEQQLADYQQQHKKLLDDMQRVITLLQRKHSTN